MSWIKEHFRFLIITAAAIALVALIIVSSGATARSSAAEKSAATAAAAVSKPVSYAGSGITSFFSGLIHFRDIQKENYQLSQENEELKEELAQAQLSEYELNQLKSLSNELNISSYDDSYTRVTGQVISIDTSGIFDIFNINAGTDDGVAEGDIVVNEDGLVGRVMSAGGSWAKIISIIDASNSLSFTLARDPGVTGIISGSGDGTMGGYIFDDSKSLVEGDTLITSGIGYYPEGIEIATVTSVEIDNETMQKTLQAESSVDFKSIRYVTVLTQQ